MMAIRPLRQGVISDYPLTEHILRECIQKVSPSRFFKPWLHILVPTGITEVEKQAISSAGLHAGAKQVSFMEKPVPAALGSGLDITQAEGQMVVDIGAGSTDISVLSFSHIVETLTLKAADLQMDEGIMKYICKKHRMLIGEKTAETLKCSIGCALPSPSNKEMVAWGRCLNSGLPRALSVSSEDITEALRPSLEQILEGLDFILSRTPEELRNDIARHGIVLTGGGSLLPGLEDLISSRCGVPCHLTKDPIATVVSGIGKHLETPPSKRRATSFHMASIFH